MDNRQSGAARSLVIAGTGSGVGKTTVTLGIMAALRRRGLVVQGFKCGPDYIDPTYHKAVTSRPSRNLDAWMMGAEVVREIYDRASADADLAVIEGVMGLYDGKDPKSNTGSTAEISVLLDSAVLLVVNCQSMARSAAAIVKGFQLLDPQVKIAAVFANKVGSENHYRIVKEAIEQECGIPVVGYMLRSDELSVPERHLGLVPSIERGELDSFYTALADRLETCSDLDRLLELAGVPADGPLAETSGIPSGTGPATGSMVVKRPASSVRSGKPVLFAEPARRFSVKLAVARDPAFHFYYEENLELLQLHGAELAFFSPLAGEQVPSDADGLYIGGGFPEEFAGRLAEQTEVAESIRRAISSGMPTFAECGGYMYLTESIRDTKGQSYPMVGIVPGQVSMQTKLAALGLREVTGLRGNYLLPDGERARGHEFHYSVYEPGEEKLPQAYETQGMRGLKTEGSLRDRLVAGYTHLHFASNPGLVPRWLELCLMYQGERKQEEGL
ncbi:cobyrinate a,c-diamide synthase [Paenibacillus puerhi]|uniref:cobyrinate a,c-diamide synthase n=1 Tax=Paenibacillus puerhi TaxID=2692622 RepID=UPI00135B0569|nr:cobyrinate a,c-diamide synthase [Paenibacillus puerhi]